MNKNFSLKNKNNTTYLLQINSKVEGKIMILIINSVLFGILLFFSAIISPIIFRVLDQTNSALIIRAIFPKVFALGFILSVISAFGAYLYGDLLSLGLSFVGCSLFAMNFLYLMPKINETKDNLELNTAVRNKRFNLLHSASVLNYLICMLISFGLIFLS